MEFQKITAQHLGQSSSVPDYYGPSRFQNHFYILVSLGDGSLGPLVGARSGQLTRFARRADALRFCAGRNKAEKQRIKVC